MSSAGPSPKQTLFAQFAAVAKALSHSHRLELLEQLAQGEASVELLAEKCGLSIANASQHLQQMLRAGLAANRRDGKFVFYRLADDAALDAFAAISRIAELNNAEVARVVHSYFDNRDGLEPVTRKELMRRVRNEGVTILDVRPPDEFARGHLPGAVNIPLRALKARIAELDPSREIIAYCRGAYCVLSYEAVHALRARGFRARRLEEGLPEWRRAGLPVDTGP